MIEPFVKFRVDRQGELARRALDVDRDEEAGFEIVSRISLRPNRASASGELLHIPFIYSRAEFLRSRRRSVPRIAKKRTVRKTLDKQIPLFQLSSLSFLLLPSPSTRHLPFLYMVLS